MAFDVTEKIREARCCALLRAYSAACALGGSHGALIRIELEYLGSSFETEEQARLRASDTLTVRRGGG